MAEFLQCQEQGQTVVGSIPYPCQVEQLARRFDDLIDPRRAHAVGAQGLFGVPKQVLDPDAVAVGLRTVVMVGTNTEIRVLPRPACQPRELTRVQQIHRSLRFWIRR
ncbi:hypothetical protein [Micromonospora sp. CPCC 206061]|uniref:hypothetical protein n=1 Tax=Micromonospora sp. CPCC 206061 TaxID=3122410 RepID=UPI002FF31AA5